MNRYNPEGYLDPTVYEALSAIEREERRRLRENRARTRSRHFPANSLDVGVKPRKGQVRTLVWRVTT